ncbi:MAG: hypothetical protein HYT30_01490 [Parcubacteria group bacterium]|nr:hypothetical protein [Parcubacteria group bacterium]
MVQKKHHLRIQIKTELAQAHLHQMIQAQGGDRLQVPRRHPIVALQHLHAPHKEDRVEVVLVD